METIVLETFLDEQHEHKQKGKKSVKFWLSQGS